MGGLRGRLIAMTVLVATTAVVMSALFSRQVVRNEFRRLESPTPAVGLDAVAATLADRFHATGGWGGADSLLERRAPATRHALLLVEPGGRTLAASAPPLRAARAFSREGRLEVRDAQGSLQLSLVGPQRIPILAPGGGTAAILYALPPIGPVPEPPSGFLRSVTRGLWLGALLAVTLGVLIGSLFARHIARPLAELTAAARRMESGDLTPRVAARGDDEVATLARSFNAMAEGLRRGEAARRQLTRDVVHELRTPLAGLQGQIEALQDGLLPANAATLRSLHDEVRLLSQLIGDLEQLAEAEAGTLRLDLAAVPLGDALASAAAASAAAARERGVEITVAPGEGLTAHADVLRLGQVLRNLLANALAHTPPGGRIALVARSAGEAVQVTVEDTGVGIAPEHLPHVFERFYRADPSRARASGGAGLGLAIVKHLVEAQSGTVGATSEPGRGTCMTVTLPRA